MSYQRILTIQDISCVGQCSMTVAHPVMSACGHEVCMLPTAILSTHTGGFGAPAVVDLTDSMARIREHWLEQDIRFDMICTGYLGSLRAIDEAVKTVDAVGADGGIVIVDPAMADHGKLYRGLDEEYASAMKRLCGMSDFLLPNITEAAMLTGLPYRKELDEAYVRGLLEAMSWENVLLTGVGFEPGMTGFALKNKGDITFFHHSRIQKNFHGTGDLFAAAFAGALGRGKDPHRAAEIASEFTLRAIRNTAQAPAHWYGVKFETALPDLIRMLF